MSSGSVAEFASGSALLSRLRAGGQWFVIADFEGRLRGWRFEDVTSTPRDLPATPAWRGPDADAWVSSHTAEQYQQAVARTREHVADGTVYQANICRVLSASLDKPHSPAALTDIFAHGNPAPFLGYIRVTSTVPEEQVWLASASPELFIRISPEAGGALIESSPIKGTAVNRDGLTDKDTAENVMITDLVRNDVSPVCEPGTVAVRNFLNVEEHPGLVHLVSTVEGRVSPETFASDDFWQRVFDATFPPGSVSGAPKSSALRIISELESHPRGPYCGGFGWVDGDTGRAELAVGIRSFWWERHCASCGGPALHFGTGAGITWGSDPVREWEETQLKASRLIALASGGSV
jgi:para-aminobenzoate synthetase component 1